MTSKPCTESKPEKYQPTVAEIWDASEHIKYEWLQLTECLALEYSFREGVRIPGRPYRLRVYTPSDKCRYDIALEGFALHARNLLQFFHDPRKQDDIVVGDYFEPPNTWQPPPEHLTGRGAEWVKATKRRVDKQVAHLTHSRSQKEAWDVDEIYNYIAALWEQFKRTASQNRFDPTDLY